MTTEEMLIECEQQLEALERATREALQPAATLDYDEPHPTEQARNCALVIPCVTIPILYAVELYCRYFMN